MLRDLLRRLLNFLFPDASSHDRAEPKQDSDSGETVSTASKLPTKPYVVRRSLVSPGELTAYRLLADGLTEFLVMSKVRMEDVLAAPRGLTNSERSSMRGRIKSRHFDFVVCDASELQPVAVVELDDSSHRSAKAQEADRFKDRACADAGLVLLRLAEPSAECAERVVAEIRRIGP